MKQQHEQEEEEGSNRAQQQPRNARARISATKKRPWYGRALDCLHLWMQPAVLPPPPPAVEEEGSLRCCSSAKAAALAFARLLCLCAPACSHEAVLLLGVHVDAAVPTPMPRSCSARGVSPAEEVPAPIRPSVAPAWEGTTRSREPFRGRSLTDSILMRRFTLGEIAARRREEMEALHVKRRRSREEWRPPGNSRLRRMSLVNTAWWSLVEQIVAEWELWRLARVGGRDHFARVVH